MTTPPDQAVSRPRVLAGALALAAVLAAVVGLGEALRHPPTVPPVPEPVDADDPRDDIDCPPAPRTSREDPTPVGSNDLYDCPQTYDGHWVRFEGEAIGAVLPRPDGAWTQLNDDAYAGDLGPLPAHREFRGGNSGVGVHLPEDVAELIESVGGHDNRGDVLTVVGTYHQSDPDSGEAAIIRAAHADRTRPGEPITPTPLPDRRIAGSLLAMAAIALLSAGRWVSHRR